MKSPEIVIVPLPYTTRISRKGDFRMSSHTALVTDATVHVFKAQPGARIFIPGESTFGPEYPKTANLMKERLIKKGIPESAIETQDGLNDTESQLAAIKDKGIQNPLIIDMEFHDERVNDLRKGVGLQGTTIVAEEVILEAHPGATRERLRKFAATRSTMLGISKVSLAETVGKSGVKLGKTGKTIVRGLRKIMGAEGATVTDYHYVGSAKKYLEKALDDSARRERVLSYRQTA